MGPQYIESWEGHHTTELYEQVPAADGVPHPRFSFHTMGDGKESWMNEVKDHRVLHDDGHYYWIMRLNTKTRRRAASPTATSSGPSTTAAR